LTLVLACIVEGHGEVPAVPILIRRIAESLDPPLVVRVLPPLRVPRYKLVKAGEIERAVELAARKIGGAGGILILIDSEDDCPAELGPQLFKRARAARNNLPMGVVLAKHEFEAWFLAAAHSLRDCRGLPGNLAPPPDPEAVRGAKEWLSARMPANLKYQETLDQPALTAKFSLVEARQADSFDKCYREITRLLKDLDDLGDAGATPAEHA
jgi:hypothetical protein